MDECNVNEREKLTVSQHLTFERLPPTRLEVSITQFNKQEFKGELSRHEKYDKEKKELLQDNFDLH
jgi:hypothetical protein